MVTLSSRGSWRAMRLPDGPTQKAAGRVRESETCGARPGFGRWVQQGTAQGLLLIVLGEAIYRTEIVQIRRRGQLTGRLSVDVAVDPICRPA